MTKSLDGIRIQFSAALPQELNRTSRAQELQSLVSRLFVEVGRLGGEVIFGGHPTVTPLVHRLVDGGRLDRGAVHLVLAKGFDKKPPNEAHDTSVFVNRQLYGKGAAPSDPAGLADDLREMRQAMSKSSRAAVFMGGLTHGNVGGGVPGLEEEWEIFRDTNPRAPVFVTGMLDGYCRAQLVPKLVSGTLDDHTGLPAARRQRLFDATDAAEVSSIIIAQLVALARSGKL
ncbi:MAG: hypothetical protein AAGA48_03975 [Myxococcota bacterium]